MRKSDFLVFVLITVFLFISYLSFAACEFQSDPELIEPEIDHGEDIYMIWEEPNRQELFEPFDGEDEQYQLLKEWTQDMLIPLGADLAPTGLLERQREIFAPHFSTRNFDLILEGKAGSIRTINCVEALLLLIHDETFPLDTKPSEFLAHFMISDDGEWLRIYFGSGEDVRPSVQVFREDIEADLEEEWRYWLVLHNHPFGFDNPSGDIAGTTIPSPPDIRYFRKQAREVELENAWITNGFDTIEITQDEFSVFASSDKEAAD